MLDVTDLIASYFNDFLTSDDRRVHTCLVSLSVAACAVKLRVNVGLFYVGQEKEINVYRFGSVLSDKMIT
jgi:hypothetical protein